MTGREIGTQENREKAKEPSSRLRARTEQDGEMGTCGIRSSALSGIPRSSLSLVYTIIVYLVTILFVVSIGMCKCPEAIMIRSVKCIKAVLRCMYILCREQGYCRL